MTVASPAATWNVRGSRNCWTTSLQASRYRRCLQARPPHSFLADFAKIVEAFDGKGVSFVSVTQQFNTTTSMGRLTLNVLLSFAQFEREVTGERIRDKVAASKKKGMWMGGHCAARIRP
jgi:DNA invertase Pin-like site-specific DNA recombinase